MDNLHLHLHIVSFNQVYKILINFIGYSKGHGNIQNIFLN